MDSTFWDFNKKKLIWIVSLGFFSLHCNLFQTLDTPSTTNTNQILSAARACFDAGKIACATKYYNQLLLSPNNTALTDTVLTESNFIALAQIGVTIETVLTAFLADSFNIGFILTTFANAISNHNNANANARLTLLESYLNATQISNPNLMAFNQFLLALILASEILSEASNIPGNLKQSDLVADPSSCRTAISTLGLSSLNASFTTNCARSTLLLGSTPITDNNRLTQYTTLQANLLLFFDSVTLLNASISQLNQTSKLINKVQLLTNQNQTAIKNIQDYFQAQADALTSFLLAILISLDVGAP